jgi:hypothetical protein
VKAFSTLASLPASYLRRLSLDIGKTQKNVGAFAG